MKPIRKIINVRGTMDIVGFSNSDDVYEDETIDSVTIHTREKTYQNVTSTSHINQFVKKMPFSIEQMKISTDVVYDFELKITSYNGVDDCQVLSIAIQDDELSKVIQKDDIKEFTIPVYYEKRGLVHVLGTSLENAIERATKYKEDIPLPLGDEYCDGSFSIVADDAHRDGVKLW